MIRERWGGGGDEGEREDRILFWIVAVVIFLRGRECVLLRLRGFD